MTITVPSRSSSSERPPVLLVREAGAGRPLLLLHGLASSSRYWEPHLPALSPWYRMVAPDLLGFGLSPKPARCAYTTADHLAALAGALAGRIDGPATVVGHSMGAILALHLARAHPEWVRRLVLISLPVLGPCAWGHHANGRQRRLHHAAVHTRAGRALVEAGMRGAAPLWRAGLYRLRRNVPPGAARDALRATWSAYWRSLEEVVYGSDVPALFASTRVPLTLIHGGRDPLAPIAPVRALAHTHLGATLMEVPDAGHNPAYTHPDALLRVLIGT